MNLLITGAGLIGAHTAKQAAAAGHQVVLFDLNPDLDYIRSVAGTEGVTAIKGDLRDLPALLRTMKSHDIDTLVHSAGLIGNSVRENSWTGTTNNILGTINVLEAAQLQSVRRVVYVSTFGVYRREQREGASIRETDAAGRHNLYATTKYCSEQLVQTYAQHYGLEAIILRPSAIYGPGPYAGGSTVGLVMHDLVSQLAHGDAVNLEARQFAAKEYLYGEDCGMAAWQACITDHAAQTIYNIGSGVVTDMDELITILGKLEPDCRINRVGDANPGVPLPLDVTAAARDLGFTPRYSLESGLRDYLNIVRSRASASSA